jgi:hypothetical protein
MAEETPPEDNPNLTPMDSDAPVIDDLGTGIEAMDPMLAQKFIDSYTRQLVESQSQLDPDMLPFDIVTSIPDYGKWYWYKGYKRDPTNRNRIIYDIYVAPQKIAKILAKSPEVISTRWGPEQTDAYYFWTVIKGRSFDPETKRVVPVRQIIMTYLMARRSADVAKLLDKLTAKDIRESMKN